MKPIKMLGLAAVVAVAAIAVVGAGSASAGVVLCSTNTNPCTGTKAAAGSTFSAELVSNTGALFLTSLGTVKCNSSSISGTLDEAEGSTSLMSSISSMSLSSCSLNGGKCVVTTQDLPYLGLLSKLANGEWHIVMHEKSNGKPKALWECGETLKCILSHPEILFTWLQPNPPTEPHAVLHVNQELEREGGSGFLCPTSSRWQALYLIISPLGYYAEG